MSPARTARQPHRSRPHPDHPRHPVRWVQGRPCLWSCRPTRAQKGRSGVASVFHVEHWSVIPARTHEVAISGSACPWMSWMFHVEHPAGRRRRPRAIGPCAAPLVASTPKAPPRDHRASDPGRARRGPGVRGPLRIAPARSRSAHWACTPGAVTFDADSPPRALGLGSGKAARSDAPAGVRSDSYGFGPSGEKWGVRCGPDGRKGTQRKSPRVPSPSPITAEPWLPDRRPPHSQVGAAPAPAASAADTNRQRVWTVTLTVISPGEIGVDAFASATSARAYIGTGG